MKLTKVMDKVGGLKGVLKLDNLEKKLPRLVKYEMLDRDKKEWDDTKKEFAKKYGLKKIVNGKPTTNPQK